MLCVGITELSVDDYEFLKTTDKTYYEQNSMVKVLYKNKIRDGMIASVGWRDSSNMDGHFFRGNTDHIQIKMKSWVGSKVRQLPTTSIVHDSKVGILALAQYRKLQYSEYFGFYSNLYGSDPKPHKCLTYYVEEFNAIGGFYKMTTFTQDKDTHAVMYSKQFITTMEMIQATIQDSKLFGAKFLGTEVQCLRSLSPHILKHLIENKL